MGLLSSEFLLGMPTIRQAYMASIAWAGMPLGAALVREEKKSKNSFRIQGANWARALNRSGPSRQGPPTPCTRRLG